jgi:hypothetical protein
MSYEQRTLLSPAQITKLRETNRINSEEYAFIAGDLLVAENVKTSEKRVLGQAADVLSESNNRRVLKG